MKCDNCKRGYNAIGIKLKDAIHEWNLCPNCLTFLFLEDKLNFVNDLNLIDDITGNPGAVEFISLDEKYVLEKETMLRLISYNLKRHEYIPLINKYGSNKFMLHDDFYGSDGTAFQPINQ